MKRSNHAIDILEPDAHLKYCARHEASPLGYVAASLDADRRMAEGQEQLRCPECKLWVWPDQIRKGAIKGLKGGAV